MTPDALPEAYRRHARALLPRAHVPYSGAPRAVVLVDAGGRWLPGVRVENASFSLTIGALRNALTTAVATGFGPPVAALATAPFTPEEALALEEACPHLGLRGADLWQADAVLPAPAGVWSPFLDAPPPATPADGIALAARIAQRAVVPASDFRVGCVVALADGRLVPGVNVETRDWVQTLCAERNALSTLVSYGLGPAHDLFLACLACDCSPCGACRQVITELAPEGRTWMGRSGTPVSLTPEALLPDRFSGLPPRR